MWYPEYMGISLITTFTCLTLESHWNFQMCLETPKYIANKHPKWKHWKTAMNLVLYECCNNVVTDVDFRNCVQIQTQKLTKTGDHMAVGTKTPGLHPFLVDIFWNFIFFRRIGHLVEWTNRLSGSSAHSGSILFVRNCFFIFCPWKFCFLSLEILDVGWWLSGWVLPIHFFSNTIWHMNWYLYTLGSKPWAALI